MRPPLLLLLLLLEDEPEDDAVPVAVALTMTTELVWVPATVRVICTTEVPCLLSETMVAGAVSTAVVVEGRLPLVSDVIVDVGVLPPLVLPLPLPPPLLPADVVVAPPLFVEPPPPLPPPLLPAVVV